MTGVILALGASYALFCAVTWIHLTALVIMGKREREKY